MSVHVLSHKIINHAKNIELDEFVMMLNYIHGILIIKGNNVAEINDYRDVASNTPYYNDNIKHVFTTILIIFHLTVFQNT